VSADLSVVICSLNGAAGVHKCLHKLREQHNYPRLEIIVVDDGSTDNTGEVAAEHQAIVIRHKSNRGIAAARNSGLAAASAPVVAFLDDDCEPAPDWAERLLASYREDIAGVGGTIEPATSAGYLQRYLSRHNPLRPLELNLARSNRLLYRLRLYLQRQWRGPDSDADIMEVQRDVYSLVGANMSFRREVLLAAGGFDERFHFGAEEVDLCMRLRRRRRPARLVYAPDVRITHHFRASLHDVLRRSHAYGRGSARLYRKWPDVPPTVFPGPVIVAAALVASILYPPVAVGALALPLVLYPQGVRGVLRGHGLSCLLDGYVKVAQETCEDVGFGQGMWLFRHLKPEPAESASELATVARTDDGEDTVRQCTP
jgi:glycosyltransferase involved in cell wall biosynthesis